MKISILSSFVCLCALFSQFSLKPSETGGLDWEYGPEHPPAYIHLKVRGEETSFSRFINKRGRICLYTQLVKTGYSTPRQRLYHTAPPPPAQARPGRYYPSHMLGNQSLYSHQAIQSLSYQVSSTCRRDLRVSTTVPAAR